MLLQSLDGVNLYMVGGWGGGGGVDNGYVNGCMLGRTMNFAFESGFFRVERVLWS